MRTITSISEASNCGSEMTVISPISEPPSIQPERTQWRNSDHPLAPVPMRSAQPVRYVAPPMPTIPERPAVQNNEPPRKSFLSKCVTAAGAIIAIAGTMAGFVSIAVLGPIGIAVGMACAVVGSLLMAVGSKVS